VDSGFGNILQLKETIQSFCVCEEDQSASDKKAKKTDLVDFYGKFDVAIFQAKMYQHCKSTGSERISMAGALKLRNKTIWNESPKTLEEE
jgi:hypothetical protein